MRRTDSIGMALQIIFWGATLVMAGITIVLLQQPFDALVEFGGDEFERSAVSDGLHWVQIAWDALPFLVLFMGLIMMVAAAAWKSRRVS